MGASFDVTAILRANSSDFTNGVNAAKSALADLRNQSGGMLAQVGSSLKSVGSAMQSVGAGMTTAFTLPMVGGLTAVIKGYADLEQSLGGVSTLFKQNGSSVNTLARDYGMTRQQAQALYNTMDREGTNVIENANRAYRTAGVSANRYMEQVTSFSATLLQGLGGDTAKAAKYGDKALVQMSDNANKFGTNMTDIQNAYQGFAKDNYSMLDNLKLGYGGTMSEMARLVNESGVLNGEFEATADNIRDIPFHTLIDAIGITQDRLGVTGTTAKEASTTVSGSFNSMKAAAENLVAGLGNNEANIKTLMENMKQTIITFKDNVVRVLGTIWDNLPVDGWVKWTALIIGTVGPVIFALGTLITWVGNVVSAISTIGEFLGIFSTATEAVEGFSMAFEGGESVMVSFASTVEGVSAASLAAFAGIALAVGMVVAALVDLWNHNENFRSQVIAIWETIKSAITNAVQAIVSFVMSIWGQLTSFWNENHALIMQTATTYWNMFKGMIENVMNAILPVVQTGLNLLITLFSTSWQMITTVISTVIEVILNIIKMGMQILQGDWSGAWETLKTILSTVWEGIKSLVSIGINAIGPIIQAGIQFILAIWNAAWALLAVPFQALWALLQQIAGGAMTAISGVISAGIAVIQSIWSAAWTVIQTVFSTVWNTIMSILSPIMAGISSIISSTLSAIQAIWNAIWTGIQAVLAGVLAAIVGLVTGNFSQVQAAISSIMSAIQSTISAIWNAILSLISSVLSAIASTVSSTWSSIQSIISSAMSSVQSIVSSAWSAVRSAVSSAMSSIQSAITSGFSAVVSAVTSAGQRIISAVRSAFSGALSAARGFVGQAASVGSQLISGFVSGVTSAAGKLISAVKGAVSNAINGAKALLGIKSPSRVFRQFGIYTDKGFIIGIDSKADQVARSMRYMAQGAIDAFTGQDINGAITDELGSMDGQLGRLAGYDPSVSFNGGKMSVTQQAADIVLKMGDTTYRAFTEDITNAQSMELMLDNY